MNTIMILLIPILLSCRTDAAEEIKIISIISKNVTICINQNASYRQGWSYQELGSDRIVDLNVTNRSMLLSPFTFVEAGRKYYLKNLNTSQIVKKFHTIGIDDRCEVKDTMNRIVFTKGQEVSLMCSIKVKKNLLENNNRNVQHNFHSIDDPTIRWNDANQSSSSSGNMMIEWDSDNVVKYMNKFTFRVPDDDEAVWRLRNRQIQCQISHASSYEIETKLKVASPMATVTCSYHLNINFKPFLSDSVNKTQILHENQLSIIECPIKAPNFQPYKYSINWYYLKEAKNDTWIFKYSKTYDKSGDLYVISNAKFTLDDGLYRCELVESETRLTILKAVLTAQFNSNSTSGETLKSSSIVQLNTLSTVLINVVIVLILAIFVVVLVFKFKSNKSSMRISNDELQVNNNTNENKNEVTLKYELKNLRANHPDGPINDDYDNDDDQVYKENSVAIRDDDSIMKRLAGIDTKKCLVHLASKIRHKRTCAMYEPPQVARHSITTETSITSARTDVTLTPVVQIQPPLKSVHFNIEENSNRSTTTTTSEYMESVYIHGYKY